MFTDNVQVLEVRPVIDWDKGKAVTFLLESLGEFTCWLIMTIMQWLLPVQRSEFCLAVTDIRHVSI
jgi:hypothetical protein